MSVCYVPLPLEDNGDTILRAPILCNSTCCHFPHSIVYMSGTLWSSVVIEYEALCRDPGILYERGCAQWGTDSQTDLCYVWMGTYGNKSTEEGSIWLFLGWTGISGFFRGSFAQTESWRSNRKWWDKKCSAFSTDLWAGASPMLFPPQIHFLTLLTFKSASYLPRLRSKLNLLSGFIDMNVVGIWTSIVKSFWKIPPYSFVEGKEH